MSDFIWVEKYRPKTIDDCILPQGIKKTWSMRRLLKSPRYLTNWKEIPVVK